MNISEYAIYEAAFDECCKKSFGMNSKQIINLIDSHKKLEKDYKKLKSENVVFMDSPKTEEEYLYKQFQRLNIICEECKYQTYCNKSVTLSTGTEVPLASCSFGFNKDSIHKQERYKLSVLEEQILYFIKQFNTGKQIEILFKDKCCYWFAKILEMRFSMYNPKIVYDPTLCHFATKIEGKYYDIQGKAPASYYIDWSSYSSIDYRDYLLVSKNCIKF